MSGLSAFTNVSAQGPSKPNPLTWVGATREAKIPLPILNMHAPHHSVGQQSARCAECGSAGCLQGASPSAPGCPFGRDIPDIHASIARAAGIADKAYARLKILNPQAAETIARMISIDPSAMPDDEASRRTKMIDEIFMAWKALEPDSAIQAFALFQQNMREAFEKSAAKGPTGDIYGRICPASLCESSCTTHYSGHGAVTIAANEAALWNYAWHSGWVVPIKPEHERKETIFILGTGFAGYAAAERLREHGFQVVMVDKNAEPGEPGQGQILNYKADLNRFRKYYDLLRQSGVKIECGVNVDARFGVTLESLKQKFNPAAIIFAVGTPKVKDIRLSGSHAAALIPWSDFTAAYQKTSREGQGYTSIPPVMNAHDKVVAIIGAGDTAVDCARTAIREGAKRIILISRRDGLKAEDHAALEAMQKEAGEKLSIETYMQPVSMLEGSATEIKLMGSDLRGEKKGAQRIIEADMVIAAPGNHAGDLRTRFGMSNIKTLENGCLDVLPTPPMISDKQNLLGIGAGYVGDYDGVPVFAAGQVVRGDSLAAICGRDGQDVAEMVTEAFNHEDGPQAYLESLRAPAL